MIVGAATGAIVASTFQADHAVQPAEGGTDEVIAMVLVAVMVGLLVWMFVLCALP
jgi:hypothetical protein